MLQCTIATGSPEGVVTISISVCTCFNACSSTTIAKIDVPADTFPVRTPTLSVATIPVPASPSGGHNGIPACKEPVGSNNAAPLSVSTPASSPADKTFGKISFIFHDRQSSHQTVPASYYRSLPSRCRLGTFPMHRPRRVLFRL